MGRGKGVRREDMLGKGGRREDQGGGMDNEGGVRTKGRRKDKSVW